MSLAANKHREVPTRPCSPDQRAEVVTEVREAAEEQAETPRAHSHAAVPFDAEEPQTSAPPQDLTAAPSAPTTPQPQTEAANTQALPVSTTQQTSADEITKPAAEPPTQDGVTNPDQQLEPSPQQQQTAPSPQVTTSSKPAASTTQPQTDPVTATAATPKAANSGPPQQETVQQTVMVASSQVTDATAKEHPISAEPRPSLSAKPAAQPQAANPPQQLQQTVVVAGPSSPPVTDATGTLLQPPQADCDTDAAIAEEHPTSAESSLHDVTSDANAETRQQQLQRTVVAAVMTEPTPASAQTETDAVTANVRPSPQTPQQTVPLPRQVTIPEKQITSAKSGGQSEATLIEQVFEDDDVLGDEESGSDDEVMILDSSQRRGWDVAPDCLSFDLGAIGTYVSKVKGPQHSSFINPGCIVQLTNSSEYGVVCGVIVDDAKSRRHKFLLAPSDAAGKIEKSVSVNELFQIRVSNTTVVRYRRSCKSARALASKFCALNMPETPARAVRSRKRAASTPQPLPNVRRKTATKKSAKSEAVTKASVPRSQPKRRRAKRKTRAEKPKTQKGGKHHCECDAAASQEAVKRRRVEDQVNFLQGYVDRRFASECAERAQEITRILAMRYNPSFNPAYHNPSFNTAYHSSPVDSSHNPPSNL